MQTAVIQRSAASQNIIQFPHSAKSNFIPPSSHTPAYSYKNQYRYSPLKHSFEKQFDIVEKLRLSLHRVKKIANLDAYERRIEKQSAKNIDSDPPLQLIASLIKQKR